MVFVDRKTQAGFRLVKWCEGYFLGCEKCLI